MAVGEVAEKQARALALHLQGATFDQIAQVLGYATRSGAHRAVQTALQNRVPTASRLEAYRLEAARCDLVLTALAPSVKAGDPKSVALFLAASERRTVLSALLDDSAGALGDQKPQEVRTPLDELHARRAARTRGTARGTRTTGAGVPAVRED